MLLRFCLAILLICRISAVAAETLREQLQRNQALWESLGIVSYKYKIDREGGWLDPPAMDVVVMDGVLKAVRRGCYLNPLDTERCTPRDETVGLEKIAQTIPQIFDSLDTLVANAQNDPRAQIILWFDSKYGIPTRFYYNNPGVSEGAGGFWITTFSEL